MFSLDPTGPEEEYADSWEFTALHFSPSLPSSDLTSSSYSPSSSSSSVPLSPSTPSSTALSSSPPFSRSLKRFHKQKALVDEAGRTSPQDEQAHLTSYPALTELAFAQLHPHSIMNPVVLRLQTSRERHKLFLENCRHQLQSLNLKGKAFNTKCSHQLRLMKDQYRAAMLFGDGLLRTYDDNVSRLVREYFLTLTMEKESQSKLAERESHLAESTKELLRFLLDIRIFGVELHKETSANIKLHRLSPRNQLHGRCERVFEKSIVKRPGDFDHLVCDVFQIENRVLLNTYEEKLRNITQRASSTMMKEDEMSGFPTQGDTSPGDAHSPLRSNVRGLFLVVPPNEFYRLCVYGFHHPKDGKDAPLFEELFPFWLRRFMNDEKTGKSNVQQILDQAEGFDRPICFSEDVSLSNEEGVHIVMLCRVITGHAFEGIFDEDTESMDRILEVFDSIHDEDHGNFYVNDPAKCLPEFVYVVQTISMDRTLLLPSEMLLNLSRYSRPESKKRGYAMKKIVNESDGIITHDPLLDILDERGIARDILSSSSEDEDRQFRDAAASDDGGDEDEEDEDDEDGVPMDALSGRDKVFLRYRRSLLKEANGIQKSLKSIRIGIYHSILEEVSRHRELVRAYRLKEGERLLKGCDEALEALGSEKARADRCLEEEKVLTCSLSERLASKLQCFPME